jgi:hypothetical protein
MRHITKNVPSKYRSRAMIARGTEASETLSLDAKAQRKRLEAARLDARWYIQFPIKPR